MVPIVTLLGGVEIGDRLATAVGLPGWLGASVTGVAAFFVSRAILVRAFATKGR